jgi:phosphoribosylformimino-5-aminoimidazole carboxamide ribotide isomerase
LKSNFFEVVPVIDILGGTVVRGVKGERNNYKPVSPIFCHSSDPLTVARSYKEKFDFQSIYVADLDRITGKGNNLDVICQLKKFFQDPGHVYCDPGISGSEELETVHPFIDNLVIGTETLQSLRIFEKAIITLGSDKVTASLDIKAGKVLSQSRELQQLEPARASRLLAETGVRKMFVIKLDAVGTGEGIDFDFYSSLKTSGMKLLPGGGIKNLRDIIRLKLAGFAGCMVASSLYSGAIIPSDLQGITR